VDHNKMQSDTWVEKVSSLGDLEAKFAAFGWHVRRCDGHDLRRVAAVLAEFRGLTDRPKALIADTVKGRGVTAMENTALGEDELYRFHSGAPASDIYQAGIDELTARVNGALRAAGSAPLALETVEAADRPAPRGERLIGAYAQALLEQGRKREDLVVLDADLMLDCGLIPFRDAFPARFVECGIAEQDMVSQAGMLALHGKLPVAHSFACFLSTRPNEQIYNNATELSKVVYVGSLAGLIPSGPGHSHQSVRDISTLAAVPGLTLIEPCCEEETRLALDYCINAARNSCYLRLVSVPCEIPFRLPAHYRFERGKGVELRPGSQAVLFGYGPLLLPQAWRAAEMLEREHGVSLAIVNLPWLNEVDGEWLHAAVGARTHVFTLDNHYVEGGQGQMLLARLAELGAHRSVTRLGVREIPACGQNAETLRAHGLDAEGIAAAVARALRGA
jgi:transketolase